MHKIATDATLKKTAVGTACTVVVNEMDMLAIPQEIAWNAVAVDETMAMEIAQATGHTMQNIHTFFIIRYIRHDFQDGRMRHAA